MLKFDSNWTQDLVQELLLVHRGKSHLETATELTRIHGVIFSRDAVKNKYNNLTQFGNPETPDFKPSEFVKNREYFDKTVSDESKKGKRVYFVTSAIAGCKLAKDFFTSIENFCKDRQAKLVVLPMRGISAKDEEFEVDVLEQLSDHFYTDYTFNSNIEGFDLFLTPQQVNPLTGIQRVSKKSSVIVASPKQNLEVTPVSNMKVPHLLMSTGAITISNYGLNRVGMLATEDHVLGGIVLEIEDNEIFHVRQVQAGEDGGFYDLHKKYSAKGVEVATSDAIVFGDLHAGSEDPKAINAWKEAMKLTKPKYVILHDAFDGRSINHHEENNLYARITRPESSQLLKTELDLFADTIQNWSKEFPMTQFMIVKSNHDEFLDRYLDAGRFVFDPHNYRVALDLAVWRADGFNAIEKYVEAKVGKLPNVTFLRRNEDFQLNGVLLSAHGDRGANGSRGTVGGMEKNYENCITGHTHSPKILRNAWVVGTSTYLKLPYNDNGGASSWLHTSCLLYDNGQRSLINAIDGKWRI